jgi:hypothetical protein
MIVASASHKDITFTENVILYWMEYSTVFSTLVEGTALPGSIIGTSKQFSFIVPAHLKYCSLSTRPLGSADDVHASGLVTQLMMRMVQIFMHSWLYMNGSNLSDLPAKLMMWSVQVYPADDVNGSGPPSWWCEWFRSTQLMMWMVQVYPADDVTGLGLPSWW